MPETAHGTQPMQMHPPTQPTDHVVRPDPTQPTDHVVRPTPAAPAEAKKAPTPQEAAEFAKGQAKAKGEMSKKHAKAKSEAKDADAVAALTATQAKEKAELEDKQAEERKQFDPSGAVKLPTFNGMAIQDAVAALHDELSGLAGEHNFEVGELRNFGTEFDVFDPVTGMLVSPARSHRRDVGDAGQLMGAGAVVNDIVSARSHQMSAGVTQYAADRVV